MHHSPIATSCLLIAFVLAGCGQPGGEAEVERAIKDLNVIDETNLNDIMLTVADPDEAVDHFRRTAAANPGRIDLRRGLGASLIRAKRPTEAAAAWSEAAAHPEAGPSDRVALADALIRAGDWDAAAAALARVPPTHESYRRYRLEAMIADSRQDWGRADSHYETAAALTTKPGGVLNNWGYSKLARGDHAAAEALFGEAIAHEPDLFTAKNNLALARGAQRDYTLPIVPMTQIERAQLLHTLGLAAVKQGDVAIGKGLLEQALAAHPRHFDAAATALAALDGSAG